MKTKHKIHCPDCGGTLRELIEDGTEAGKTMSVAMIAYLKGIRIGNLMAFETLKKLKNKKKK